MARKLAALAFSLGCLHASSLMALGLGEMKLESFLNEPLKASVDLLNMGSLHEDEIRIRLATTEDFDKLGLERSYFLTNISFEVVRNEQGGAMILIRSEEPVLEPYLDFVVEARWPSGRLLREYTVLVDPPVFSQATPVVSASERVAETDGIPAAAKKNEPYDYNSRVRADTRDSNRAPGAMPRRDYSADTQGSPTPGSRYTIGRDQTLWEIASRAKPPGASVHQTMLDIQRLNPDAFINGNINRIKAGYVIYLPSADDISSGNLNTALEEVRQQNRAWREGRDQEYYAGSGPSLRISAEPEDAANAGPSDQASPTSSAPAADTGPAESSAGSETSANPSPDVAERLAALEQQLETLQRIVSLKDDQIAALQRALTEAGGTVTEATPTVGPAPEEAAVTEVIGEAEVAQEPVTAPSPESEPETQNTPSNETEVAEPAKPTVVEPPAPAAVEENWTSYLLYLLGILVLTIGGLVFLRRRSADVDAEELVPARQAKPAEDVFADIQLRDQSLEVVPAVVETQAEVRVPPTERDNRGYGERKHDEYASDIDAADALAEADIYIAYGRHPQAIDLLNNALAAEPSNPIYRLKLMEIYAELNNRVAATAQLRKVEASGDPDSIARAESLMAKFREDDAPEAAPTMADKPVNRGPGLTPNPLEILSDSNETLEEDFSGLEIESPDASNEEDDLDLSRDFEEGPSDKYDDEELVIAADSNALSTKLDLARAYLDMGDDDGARQILDEVVAEGSEELKSEARALLDRIGG